MAYVSMKQLLETGVHFGHQTRRWNPKMRPYIFGARNGIHIVDLQQTVKLFQTAHDAIVDTVARGGRVIFIGTKRQAQETVEKEAARADQFFVTNRWMGGTLTNFATIRQSIDRLKKIEAMFEDGSISRFTKKEALTFSREAEKLNAVLGGIKNMERLPDMAFIIDPKREEIAVKECRKLNIPIAAVTDTNCDPDVIDYVVPGNDDAIRAIKLFVSHIADACLEGAARRKDEAAKQKEEAAAEKAAAAKAAPAPEASASTAETPAPKTEEAVANVTESETKAEEKKAEAAAEASQTPEASAPAAKAADETAKPE
ncbi:30S ribosomal protein S2 [Oceanidesulfovibrio marinus]|uniref:Small ribosomal subunit protein uS2 n=1 Tax=Oceanidesulfovibrio marinus TaxID=370038 RepID=A0A6P1ZKW0_9BACT|nr:30S ribosomal protein S2 [Oceanidesulfovibrio marinus]TVM36412.1 30S ribosomal protein S2 [Oceanidesulfovibrio marinus]